MNIEIQTIEQYFGLQREVVTVAVLRARYTLGRIETIRVSIDDDGSLAVWDAVSRTYSPRAAANLSPWARRRILRAWRETQQVAS